MFNNSENVTVHLGAVGSQEIARQLESGGTLSQLIAGSFHLFGNAISFMPRNTDPKTINFSKGGNTSLTHTLKWLSSEITSRFSDRRNWCLLVEDSWAHVNDLNESDLGKSIILGESIYYPIEYDNFDENNLEMTIRRTKGFRFSLFLSRSKIKKGADMEERDGAALEFADKCDMVAVSSFDRDGLLVCYRR